MRGCSTNEPAAAVPAAHLHPELRLSKRRSRQAAGTAEGESSSVGADVACREMAEQEKTQARVNRSASRRATLTTPNSRIHAKARKHEAKGVPSFG